MKTCPKCGSKTGTFMSPNQPDEHYIYYVCKNCDTEWPDQNSYISDIGLRAIDRIGRGE